MKKQLLSFGVMAMLLVGASAYAQEINLKANIPFDFIVAGKTLPAGMYNMKSVGSNQNDAVVVRGETSKDGAMVMGHRVESREAATQSKLVFRRYGHRYFLSQLWQQGDSSGNELPKSKREAEVALDYPSEQVVLVATLR